jgi:hypothetical protein
MLEEEVEEYEGKREQFVPTKAIPILRHSRRILPFTLALKSVPFVPNRVRRRIGRRLSILLR